MLISSFIEMGGILRFDSHLIDTESGQLVAALSVSGPRDEYATLIEELTRQVAAVRSVPVPTARERAVKAGAPCESWEAYTYLERSMHYHNLGRSNEAFEEVLRWLYLEPYCAEALRHAINLAPSRADLQITLDLANRAISKYSSEPVHRGLVGDAYNTTFNAYRKAKQFEQALEVIEKALAADIHDYTKMVFLMLKVTLLENWGRASPDVVLGIYRQVLDYPAEQGPLRLPAAVAAASILVQQNEMGEATSLILEVAGTAPEPNWGY